MIPVKIGSLAQLLLKILGKVRFDHFHNFQGGFCPKNFLAYIFMFLGEGLGDGVKSRKINFGSLENPAVKVGCPPTSYPALHGSYIYINGWASELRKRNRFRNSSTLGVIGIVVTVQLM